MNELLYPMFYVGVIALVAGCIAYLVVTRETKGKPDSSTPIEKDRRRKAEELSGSYRLSDLESILRRLASMEAWGMVVELELPRGGAQMTVDRDGVVLYESGLRAEEIELFRHSAAGAGVQIQPSETVEGQYCVKLAWVDIKILRPIIKSRHGVGDDEPADVRIF